MRRWMLWVLTASVYVCAAFFVVGAQAAPLEITARPTSLDPTTIETVVRMQTRASRPGWATLSGYGLVLPNYGTSSSQGEDSEVRVRLHKGRNRFARTIYVQQQHEEIRRRTWRPPWLNGYVWVWVPDRSNAVQVIVHLPGATVTRTVKACDADPGEACG